MRDCILLRRHMQRRKSVNGVDGVMRPSARRRELQWRLRLRDDRFDDGDDVNVRSAAELAGTGGVQSAFTRWRLITAASADAARRGINAIWRPAEAVRPTQEPLHRPTSTPWLVQRIATQRNECSVLRFCSPRVVIANNFSAYHIAHALNSQFICPMNSDCDENNSALEHSWIIRKTAIASSKIGL